MKIHIVSLNSCIDRVLRVNGFTIGSHARAELLSEHPAGKGMNVAGVLAKLGVSCRLHALAGHDDCKQFKSSLDKLIDATIYPAFSRTRINTTIIDPENAIDTHLRETGEEPHNSELDKLKHNILNSSDKDDLVAFCGSFPPGVDALWLESIIIKLKGKGARVVADTSGEFLTGALKTGAYLIKPNREELFSLRKDSGGDICQTARELRAKYPATSLLISDGKNGAYLFSETGEWKARATDRIEVKSSVGAGDALLAGYLASLSQKLQSDKCLAEAVKAASASLGRTRAGTIALDLLEADIDLTRIF